MCILLAIVTLGIYVIVWYYMTHEEMKKHTGRGLGGVVARCSRSSSASPRPTSPPTRSAICTPSPAAPSRSAPLTGLWYFPGMLILVGPIIWFVKTNGALNDYWKSMGAPTS